MDLFFPRYASPKNPDGIIPPSPPADATQIRWTEIERQVRSYSGRMPHVIVPGYEEPTTPSRVILPGQQGYREALTMTCMPVGVMAQRIPLKPKATSTLLTGLVWSYNFETTSWLDNLGVNNLTGNGSPTTAAGQIGNAISGGGAAFANCAYNAAFNFSGTNWTTSCWAYLTANTTFQGIWSHGDGAGTRDYGLILDGASNWRLVYVDANSTTQRNIASGLAAPSTATWYFILIEQTSTTYSAGGNTTWTFYVNGGLAGTATLTTLPVPGTHNYTGTGIDVLWDTNNAKLNGRVDALNGWTRAQLTAAEKTQLGAGTASSQYPFV